MKYIMITNPGCGKCALDKLSLKKEGLLDKVEVMLASQEPILVKQLGFKSLPIYVTLDDKGSIKLKTLSLNDFITEMRK